jgi:hypothetical protein
MLAIRIHNDIGGFVVIERNGKYLPNVVEVMSSVFKEQDTVTDELMIKRNDRDVTSATGGLQRLAK